MAPIETVTVIVDGAQHRFPKGMCLLELPYDSAAGVFAEAASQHAFLKDVDWGTASEPMQLRFGESRG